MGGIERHLPPGDLPPPVALFEAVEIAAEHVDADRTVDLSRIGIAEQQVVSANRVGSHFVLACQ